MFKINFFDEEELEKMVFSYQKKKISFPCDIAIVFGGLFMVPYRVEKAIKLYQKKKVKKILVSGRSAYFKHPAITEAEIMYQYLVDHGIPKEDILIEDQSRSTMENVKYSLGLLKESYDITSLSYVLISSDFHIKRCLGLFRHVLGTSQNVYGIGAKGSFTDISHWKDTKCGRKMIKREALLLWYYSKKRIHFE